MKAALLELDSGMHRVYPVKAHGFALLAPAVAFGVLVAGAAGAQTAPPSQERPPLGASFTVDALGALPSSASLFPLLDTAVPDVIADRIDTGGISAGAPARVGAHGSTWTQTTYRVGDADITNPTGTGTPLLMPGVDVWERVDVATGLMPIDEGAPGMAVSLVPRRPAASWMRTLELAGAPPGLNTGVATPPRIARLNSWAHGNLLVSGPVVRGQLGALLSANWIRSSYSERDSTDALIGTLGSAFVNLTSAPSPLDEIRLIGWGQRTRDAVPHHVAFNNSTAGQQDTGLHLQAAWQHASAQGNSGVRAFGSYTLARRATDLVAPSVIVVERLRDGPVPSLLDPGTGTDRAWSFGARVNRTFRATHIVLAGIDLTGGASSVQSAFAGRVGELLNGQPARVWDFTDPLEPSAARERSVAAFVGGTAAIAPRVTVEGGLRFETVDGSATAHDGTISWRSLLPRAGVHWRMIDAWQLTAFGGYARYAHRLTLNDLAYGDPTAPTASIYRWNAAAAGVPQQSALGPLVQRLGPGTGGNARFSSIDPALRRPYMDEAVFGFEARPSSSTFLRMAAIARRERKLIGVADVGVPESSYSTIGVHDQGVDTVGTTGDQILLFYNRSPATFGVDRYLLTNPAGDDGSFVGVDMLGQVRTDRLFFLMGATAGRSEGLAANRGFGPLENDVSVLGEVFIDPNARGFAQGRVFTERGYTLKLAGT
jgi:hypothetical protein